MIKKVRSLLVQPTQALPGTDQLLRYGLNVAVLLLQADSGRRDSVVDAEWKEAMRAILSAELRRKRESRQLGDYTLSLLLRVLTTLRVRADQKDCRGLVARIKDEKRSGLSCVPSSWRQTGE